MNDEEVILHFCFIQLRGWTTQAIAVVKSLSVYCVSLACLWFYTTPRLTFVR